MTWRPLARRAADVERRRDRAPRAFWRVCCGPDFSCRAEPDRAREWQQAKAGRIPDHMCARHGAEADARALALRDRGAACAIRGGVAE